jgi:hypothetical protein
MNLGEIGLGVVDWIQLAQDRDRWRAVVSAVMKGKEKVISLLPFLENRLKTGETWFAQ